MPMIAFPVVDLADSCAARQGSGIRGRVGAGRVSQRRPTTPLAIHDQAKALGHMHMPIIDQHEAKKEWAREVERMNSFTYPTPTT